MAVKRSIGQPSDRLPPDSLSEWMVKKSNCSLISIFEYLHYMHECFQVLQHYSLIVVC